MPAPERLPDRWSLVVQTLTRPYRVTVPMVLLVSLVPFYIFLPILFPARTRYSPEVALDRLVPLVPGWALVYGALYLFLIVLPVLVVRDEGHIHRTVMAYLSVWIVAYGFFLAYPTVAPRPAEVAGGGFGAWGLRALYDADPPYNCFPSLHVAHSFVSAFTCFRLHRGVGIAATLAASLVGVSTLFTKQHYAVDVVAGLLLAGLAYAVFLRGRSCGEAPIPDRRAIPAIAVGLLGFVAAVVAGLWVVYLVRTG